MADGARQLGHGQPNPPGTRNFFCRGRSGRALGPTPFMHRESARDNPQAPLAHHYLDSTHITPGVLTGGAEVGRLLLEALVVSRRRAR